MLNVARRAFKKMQGFDSLCLIKESSRTREFSLDYIIKQILPSSFFFLFLS